MIEDIQDKETSFKRVILLKNVKILLEWFWNSHLYGIYIKIKNWIEKTSSGFCSIKTNGLEENNFCISYYIFMVLKNIFSLSQSFKSFKFHVVFETLNAVKKTAKATYTFKSSLRHGYIKIYSSIQ